jgi:hypothetical protein
MSRPFLKICICLTILCAASVFAQDAATQPSTQPTIQPDEPRQVFQQFVLSIEGGQSDDLPSLCLASDADTQALVKDMQQMSAAMGQLRKVMVDKFGPGQGEDLFPFLSTDELDLLQETVTGDKAVLKGDQISTITLDRVDGKWKVDIAALRDDALPDDPQGYFAAQTKAASRTAQDILSGKLDSPESAREVLQVRQTEWDNQPMTQFSPATMQ